MSLPPATSLGPYEILFSIRAGIAGGINILRTTSDGRSYAYSAIKQLSGLQLVEGLK